mmetsp:Transcript_3674/g.10573  ORF Transcript_3674/g.10573 Transcript_3674/m.10573 type:complete len:229 (+) Transcript_3674:2157-2843(+)
MDLPKCKARSRARSIGFCSSSAYHKMDLTLLALPRLHHLLDVWLAEGPVLLLHNIPIICWIGPFIVVAVPLQHDVDTVPLKDRLIFPLLLLPHALLASAVHWAVHDHHNPWPEPPVLRLVGLPEVLFQEVCLPLSAAAAPPGIRVRVVLCADYDNVHGPHVDTPPGVVPLTAVLSMPEASKVRINGLVVAIVPILLLMIAQGKDTRERGENRLHHLSIVIPYFRLSAI